MTTHYFNLDIPTQAGDHKIVANVLTGSDGLAICEMAEQFQGLTVVVANDTKSAVRLEKILQESGKLEVRYFPDWETLPYDSFSPHQDIISSRLSALFYLQNTRKGVDFGVLPGVASFVVDAPLRQGDFHPLADDADELGEAAGGLLLGQP